MATIVVVDDEPVIRELQGELLARAGHKAELFADGQSAWARIRQGRVDLVVADLEMPLMDGLELLHHIRTMPAPPPVIVVTSHAVPLKHLRSAARHDPASETVRRATEQAFAILSKPFELPRYQELVAEALKPSTRPE